jgi:hypothetical protein
MSPTVLRQGGYQVKIYPNDHPPPHIHVSHSEKVAKVTLDPVEVKSNWGFNDRELGDILEMVRDHLDELVAEWERIHPPGEE